MAFLDYTGLQRFKAKLDVLFGGKSDKVSSATNGHLAALDSNGNLTDSGHAPSEYANKVASATSGHVATLDGNGDLTDSGHSLSDYAAASHNHDDRYYTEAEIDTQVDGLSRRIDALDPEQGVGIFQDLSISIASNAWTQSNGVWTYTYQNPVITQQCGIDVMYDSSLRTAIAGDIDAAKNTGSVVFTTNRAPIGTLTGTIRVFDSVQGILTTDKGGTGASTAAAARANLAIPEDKEIAAVVHGKQSTASIASGEYVIVKGSTISGVSDGAYKASKAIPANTDLDSTYFSSTGMSKGIANALNDKLSNIGIVQTLSESLLTTLSGNEYSACSVQSLPAGTYLVLANSSFQLTNATGERECGIYLNTTDVEKMAVPGNSQGWPRIQCFTMIELQAASEIHVRIKQTSGSAMNIDVKLTITKLK